MVGRSQTLMLTLRRCAEQEPFRNEFANCPCFGTEGSKVQILSPRPLFLRKSAEFCLLEHSVSPECSTSQIPPSPQLLPENIEKSPECRPRSLESTLCQRESLCVTLCQNGRGARREAGPAKVVVAAPTIGRVTQGGKALHSGNRQTDRRLRAVRHPGDRETRGLMRKLIVSEFVSLDGVLP